MMSATMPGKWSSTAVVTLGKPMPLWPAMGKYIPAPLAAGWWLLSSEPQILRTAVDFASLAVLIGAVFIVGKYRSTIEAQDKSGEALLRELEAQRERGDRLEQQLAEKDKEWVKFSEEQRNLRHQLKDQLAEANAKADVTAITRSLIDNIAEGVNNALKRELPPSSSL